MKDITLTPSWPAAQEAKAAWNNIRVSDADAKAKEAAADTYRQLMRRAVREADLL